MSLLNDLSEIQTALDTLAREHKVPGATLGILHDDLLVEFATGVANVSTGVETTTDTLFQIGSNTKVYTGTLVMQLVDEGKVDLDAPVRTYLPEFTLADADVAEAITVGQLLSHTGGTPGDYYDEFGSGDDAIERFVLSLAKQPAAHEPGELFSYSNAGYSVLGHLVEKLRGEPYSEVFKNRLCNPLGMGHTTVVPEEMLAFRVAAGHVVIPKAMAALPMMQLVATGEPIMAPLVAMGRCASPAGSRTASTPRDVLTFVRMHLDGGMSSLGMRILSEDAVQQMRQPHAQIPTGMGDENEVGLSWAMRRWSGQRVLGHGGGTIGQLSWLEVVPEQRFAVCLLTNSTGGPFLWRDLGTHLFKELAGVDMPAMLPKAPEVPAQVDLSCYEGRFENVAMTIEVTASDGKLKAAATAKPTPLTAMASAFGAGGGTQQMTLTPIDDERFFGEAPFGGTAVVSFLRRDAEGRAKYFHLGARAARRVAEAQA